MTIKKKNITYLAPGIPALSETFVYNEVFALRLKGYSIHPVSIHEPTNVSPDVKERMGPVTYLYKGGLFSFILAFFSCLLRRPSGMFKGLSWVISDYLFVGIF